MLKVRGRLEATNGWTRGYAEDDTSSANEKGAGKINISACQSIEIVEVDEDGVGGCTKRR